MKRTILTVVGVIMLIVLAALLIQGGRWLHWRRTHSTVTVINETGQEVTRVSIRLYMPMTALVGQGMGKLEPGARKSAHFKLSYSADIGIVYVLNGEKIDPETSIILEPRGNRVLIRLKPDGVIEAWNRGSFP